MQTFVFGLARVCIRYVRLLPGSACQGSLRMVGGPAHGPRVDLVKLASSACHSLGACPCHTLLFEELLFAVPHSRRDGSVV